MRILFTGGSGKAGRHVVPYLIESGHRVLNVDKVPLEADGVDNRIADITDAGQMYDVMASYAGFDEMLPGTGVPKFDAVVHFAAVTRMLLTSDNECYRVTTIGTYNVIDAALKMGVRKIIFASSETTYGICFADGEVKPDYLPIDEEHPVVPMDSYAMSKVVNEITARSFQKVRSGHLWAKNQQRDRAPGIRAEIPSLFEGSETAAPKYLRLHRCPRSRTNGGSLPKDGRPGLRNFQCI